MALIAVTPGLLGTSRGTAATAGSLSATPTKVFPGGKITLTGRVPPQRSRPIVLQRRQGSSWATITRKQSSDEGRFTFITRAYRTTTTYRVLAPRATLGGRTYAAVSTPSRRVTVVQRRIPFVTRISRNGRYFLDQHGRPILVKGDSPWAILVNSTRTQMDNYLAIRKSQGFNTVLLSLLGNGTNGGPSDSGATHDGVLPFVGGRPSHLNPRYWDRVAHFLGEARRAGITVMAYPLDGWTGTTYSNGLASDWSTTTARAYGEAVAARLHGYENVIWAVGGDYSDESDVNARFNAVLTGLRRGGMDRAATIQRIADTTSLDSSYWKPKVDFSFVYSYAVTYAMVERGYRQSKSSGRHVPALMGEAHYEAYENVTDQYLRSMAAWSLTSGSPGEFYGSEDVWASAPRSAALRTTAVAQLSALRRAFGGLSGWHRLVPTFGSTFITAGRGTKGNRDDDWFPGDPGGTYVTGARTPDGRLAVIYLPDASRQIRIDEDKMGAGYTARWVDPTNGDPTATSADPTYSRSQANAAGDSDWLLVLRSSTPVS